MAYFQLMSALLITWSSFFVWWTKHEVIFPERTAPKFIFDLVIALFLVPYQAFWL
jgi:hypothetical protein